jgi:chromosome segregation ATPase
MSIEGRVLTMLTSIQISITSLRSNLNEAMQKLDTFESKFKTLEANQVAIKTYLDKLASNQAVLYDKMDKLDAKVMKLEAGQTYMNRKIDASNTEYTKIVQSLSAIQNEYKEQIKNISTEVDGLSRLAKENMYTLAQLRYRAE